MEVDFGFKASRVDWGDPDIVLFVSPALFATGIAALAARLHRRRPRTVIWIQDLYGRGFEESHASASLLAVPMQAIEGAVLSTMDKVVVIHDRFRSHVCQTLGLPGDKVDVVRNWSHIEAPSATDRALVRQRLGWAEDDIVVLHAGNMGVKQGLDNVVEAARLAERYGSRTRFVLVGGGNQLNWLQELGENVSRLQFLDPLPDAEYSTVLAAADVLLVNEKPGVRDMSVPSKLTSYFVTARPVLAAVEIESATAGELEASGAGTVVTSGDPEALLHAAEQMAADPETASRLGCNGPLYAAEHLAAGSAMRRWDTTLRSLLAPDPLNLV
jgi:glycosyltransferase involved in cell wall biosynthesis